MDLGDITKGGGSTTTSVNQLNVPQLAFNTITDTTTTLNANTRFTDQILRVGLNYRLN
jgi:outer membrane immunogenic protein